MCVAVLAVQLRGDADEQPEGPREDEARGDQVPLLALRLRLLEEVTSQVTCASQGEK